MRGARRVAAPATPAGPATASAARTPLSAGGAAASAGGAGPGTDGVHAFLALLPALSRSYPAAFPAAFVDGLAGELRARVGRAPVSLSEYT